MADTTILSGDVGVTWFDNNRQKRLTWEGTTGTYTMNQLYSAMQTLQDEETTIDDGTCFSAETPTEYTIGIIDQGDNEPWYTTYELMEHITGGALKTASWTRVETTNTGIIMVEVASASNSIVAADEGNDITHTDGDSGTLLEVLSDGGTSDYLMIRPDSSAAANSFDNTTGTLTCNGNTATSITAVGKTGEQIWANLYSIGTVEPFVHMYIYQGAAGTTDARSRVYSWNDNSIDWYSNGHIDTTIALKDMTDVSVGSVWTVIDSGYVTVYARRGGSLYASFEVSNSTTSGGRNPVPLQTSADGDQSHGTKKISTGAWSGQFTDGEIISQATTLARGIIDLENSTTDSQIVYFPITKDAVGGSLTAMADTYLITGATSGETATASSGPSDDGAADATWFTGSGVPTIAFANTTADIDNDGTDEWYGITVDCNQNSLQEVYDWLKYITQYGQGSGGVIDTAESGIYGEEYIGGSAYLTYSTITGTISEGEAVTQATTGAKGVIISHDTTNKAVLLRSTRGSFADGYQVDADDDADNFNASGLVAASFAATTSAPLGTLPGGGTFFGARGVLLTDYKSTEENSFILTDIAGGTYARPTSISLTITNLEGGAETSAEHDRVAMFRLTGAGGNIDKTEYDVTGTPAAGDATLAISGTITDDTPDAGSLVIVVDPGAATAAEYAVRYSSWTSGTFTLANVTGTAEAGTGETTIVDTGNFTTAKRGDLVYTSKGLSYIETVDDNDTIQLTKAITGLTTSDAYELNAVPVALDSGDDVYVPFIYRHATTSEESASIIYVAQIYYRVKVRNTRDTVNGAIKPFSSDGTTSGTNVSVQVVRTPDTIIT
jgi:hypothetical protein